MPNSKVAKINKVSSSGWMPDKCMRSNRVVRTRPTANAEVATVLGSIPASSDTVKSEGWQMKQCWIEYLQRRHKIQKIPLLKLTRTLQFYNSEFPKVYMSIPCKALLHQDVVYTIQYIPSSRISVSPPLSPACCISKGHPPIYLQSLLSGCLSLCKCGAAICVSRFWCISLPYLNVHLQHVRLMGRCMGSGGKSRKGKQERMDVGGKSTEGKLY